MTTAAIYIPASILDSERFEIEGYDYLKHRGYEYVGTYRQPHYVDRLLEAGIATLVVFARSAHWEPDRGWPAQFVDETTRPIRWPRPMNPMPDRERRGTVNWSGARVREVVDGNGPVPRGLDAEAIEAARRIARHLSNCDYR